MVKMGRPKGGKNRYWSKEKKLKIVKEVLESHKIAEEVAKRENISGGMLSTWIKK